MTWTGNELNYLNFFWEGPRRTITGQTLSPACALTSWSWSRRRGASEPWPPCVPSRDPPTSRLPRRYAAAADVNLSWSRSPWSAGDENYARSTPCPSTATTRTLRPHQVKASSWSLFPALFVGHVFSFNFLRCLDLFMDANNSWFIKSRLWQSCLYFPCVFCHCRVAKDEITVVNTNLLCYI